MDLEVGERRERDVCLLRLDGEARAETVGPLLHAATEAIDQGCKLLIDMGGVPFVDSAAVGAIVQIVMDARARGRGAALYGVPRIAQRVLGITGLDGQLPIADDEAGARALLL